MPMGERGLRPDAAQDAASRALLARVPPVEEHCAAAAALISECDADQQFRFLALDTVQPERISHMRRFLEQQDLDPDRVSLPFIVLVAVEMGETRRSVLHGQMAGPRQAGMGMSPASLHEWLDGVLDAFLASPETRAHDIQHRILLPALGPHVTRLAVHAYAAPPPNEAAAPLMDGDPAAVTPSPPDPVAPPPSAPAARPPVHEQQQQLSPDSDDEDDEFGNATPMVLATVPTRSSKGRGGSGSAGVLGAVSLASKERERMVASTNPTKAGR